MESKTEINKRMEGKDVIVVSSSPYRGVVLNAVDELTLLVKNADNDKEDKVSIFDVRSI